MAGRSARSRRASQDSGLLLNMRTPERQRRSLSQGDDTPRPTGVLQGAGSAATSAGSSSFNSGQTMPVQMHVGDTNISASLLHVGGDPPGHTPNKRLGFLGEKLLSSSVSGSSAATLRGTPTPQSLPRSHSRAESANLLMLSRESTASPAPSMATISASPLAKGHTSPSKLVSREMHRLGTLAHLPVLNPSISAASSLTLATASGSGASSSAPADSPWPTLHLLILPLFNGEPLRIPIEDLNALVKRHIQSVISSTPSKALATLEKDATELIANGMVTLNAKLAGIEDENKLVSRVVEVWGFFWVQVLPYVEGALLPLQTDPMISSLYRMPKVLKPSSPSAESPTGKNGTTPFAYTKAQSIDVRTIALQLFRDQIIYPIFPILHDWLNEIKDQFVSPGDLGFPLPRLQQMLLVLVSQRSAPPSNSSAPSAGEEAIHALLRVIRTPLVHTTPSGRKSRYHFGSTGAPSFLSAGLPRDRRGRIAQKPGVPLGLGHHDLFDGDDGGETPKVGANFTDPTKQKGWEVLESLRSPDPEGAGNAGVGGWGLGVGAEERRSEDEEEDDAMDWDKAQAAVERMMGGAGMKSEPMPQPLADVPMSRRRMT